MSPITARHAHRKPLAFAAAALAATLLAACGGGGGGGNVRPDPPPLAPPPPPPVVNAPDPAYSEHLLLTGADIAHDAGFTGAGIRIGIVDSGVNSSHPAFGDRVVSNLVYISGSRNDLSVDDVVGHGTAVAQAAAGQPFGSWPGGIAPGAEIVSARIISDEPPEDDGSGEGNEVDGPLGFMPIHEDLISRGVRIMNNSWGGLYWTNPNATDGIASEYRPFILEHDGLVVFASGNSGFDDPSDMAALPSQPGANGSRPAADLERGWITVGALDRDDPTQLAEYSNACGLAMDYCMVAPGSVVVTGTDDAPDAPEYWRWAGTSLAAPLVSGAAALVWEAFPYFDNDAVRQTLLGTATDLGAPGLDEVFGHGALDAGKAVSGPARLDWGDLSVSFNAITSIWGNDLSGEGGLVKRGSGTLVLDADAGNAGGLQVVGGSLEVSGGVSGDVLVNANGRFAFGTGVDGDVDNAGRVDVRGTESGSELTVTTLGGDYRHRNDATFAIELGQRLDVSGRVDIEGGDAHVSGVKSGYTTERVEQLIQAEGGVNGSFDTLTWADSIFLAGELSYGSQEVWLTIARLDVAATAAGFGAIRPAALASAERVERAFQVLDRLQRGGGGAVTEGFIRIAGDLQRIDTQSRASQALSSLSGELHANSVAMTLDTIDMGRRALSARFDAFDGGTHGAGVWKRSLGRGGEGGFAGNGFALDGWVIGSDSALGNGRVAGFAFGEARAHGRVDGLGDRSHDRQTSGTAYAGWVQGDAYLLGQAGTGRFQRDIERRLFAGDRSSGVASRYSGDYTMASVEAGYRLDLAGFALSPYLGAEHVRLGSDGFSEGGAEGFGLRADAWEAERSQAIAGLRFQRDWKGLDLHGYGEWQQTLSARGFDVQASFVGVDAWAPMAGNDALRSGGVFGVGVQAGVGRNAVLGFGYDQRFGPRGDERMASLRYAVGF
ncbi:autotransporter serine protease [Luteimonas terricola]|uniref:Serine protease n=1 Tax=Luteimonas terricola TaxID=645597 RepID=A0ABQ2EDE4_9GAMM|nr:autotransporter serine protease [Luteimonas terricola]GGK02912.1 serine protease [Luteimonas terricola]